MVRIVYCSATDIRKRFFRPGGVEVGTRPFATMENGDKSWSARRPRSHCYEDIGVRLGAKYFQRFDEDGTLKKEAVNNDEQNINKLLSSRIDTFVTTDSSGDYLIHMLKKQNMIKKAYYGYFEKNPVYIGISKNSPRVQANRDKIITVIQDLIKSGETDGIITDYFKLYNLPVPHYK